MGQHLCQQLLTCLDQWVLNALAARPEDALTIRRARMDAFTALSVLAGQEPFHAPTSKDIEELMTELTLWINARAPEMYPEIEALDKALDDLAGTDFPCQEESLPL